MTLGINRPKMPPDIRLNAMHYSISQISCILNLNDISLYNERIQKITENAAVKKTIPGGHKHHAESSFLLKLPDVDVAIR